MRRPARARESGSDVVSPRGVRVGDALRQITASPRTDRRLYFQRPDASNRRDEPVGLCPGQGVVLGAPWTSKCRTVIIESSGLGRASGVSAWPRRVWSKNAST
jgi:hypothetical protein